MISPSPSHVLTVTQLTGLIRRRLESDSQLAHCQVTGELSNFKHHTSGHMYFTLKDDTARLRAIMFSSKNRNLTFSPKDGMRVVCTGSIGVFDRDGQYQLYVDDMQPDGVGALYAAFVELRDRLNKEGLFSPDKKRPLPRFPKVIGVVTSPTGAVIRDICSTLKRRYPLAKIVLSPALVQGPGAAQTIVEAISRLVAGPHPKADLLIVGRGGGSLEELWPFNEEDVARAVASCPVPVISAVGHETDFTICDFVADVRAATPTAAAELAAPNVDDLLILLETQGQRASKALQTRVTHFHHRLDMANSSMSRSHPLTLVDRLRERIDYHEGQLKERIQQPLYHASRRLNAARLTLLRVRPHEQLMKQLAIVENRSSRLREIMQSRLNSRQTRLSSIAATLEALNPLAVLARGYSIVTTRDNVVVTSSSHVGLGDVIGIQLQDGTISAKVTDEKEDDYGRPIQSRLNI